MCFILKGVYLYEMVSILIWGFGYVEFVCCNKLCYVEILLVFSLLNMILCYRGLWGSIIEGC